MPPVPLADGVYQVRTDRICAGFEVKDGRVTHCAPILRKHFERWIRYARRITVKDPRNTL